MKTVKGEEIIEKARKIIIKEIQKVKKTGSYWRARLFTSF